MKEVDIHATTAKTALKSTRHSFAPMPEAERDADTELHEFMATYLVLRCTTLQCVPHARSSKVTYN